APRFARDIEIDTPCGRLISISSASHLTIYLSPALHEAGCDNGAFAPSRCYADAQLSKPKPISNSAFQLNNHAFEPGLFEPKVCLLCASPHSGPPQKRTPGSPRYRGLYRLLPQLVGSS